ncbi:MAG: hypothetical protein WC095_01870 [Candidatus Paceibacterota bacterium]
MSLLVHEECFGDITVVRLTSVLFGYNAVIFYHMITMLRQLGRKTVLDTTFLRPEDLNEISIQGIIYSIVTIKLMKIVVSKEEVRKHLEQYKIHNLVEILPDKESALRSFKK